jgi:polysaccharide export outer membrane protein
MSSSKSGFIVAFAAAQVVLAGCGGKVGQFVWVDAYRAQPVEARPGYRIAVGDLLGVRVWNQESVSGRARVRPDGMISLPLVNDVPAAGAEPSALALQIQAKLKEFMVNPSVSVSVEEQAPFEISILGEVARPGVYRIEHDASMLKAFALAGGLTQIAARERIFVLRYGESEDPRVPIRIRFTYQALTQAEGTAARFGLRNGDVVVVE